MAIFNLYAYDIKQAEGEREIFPDKGGSATKYETAEECFGSFFGTKRSFDLPILKTKGKGEDKVREWDKYHCEVARHERGIILLTLENNKVKHTIVNKEDHENPHHPFCQIIIDNRMGKQTICIERNSSFDNNTDKVASLFAMGMSNLMARYNLQLTVSRLKKISTDFWSVVHDLRDNYKDQVRQIRLDFNGDEQSKDANGFMHLLTKIASRAESEAVFMLNAEGDKEVKLQEIYDDLTHMADLCLQQKNYGLSVKFKKFGVYRYGADLLAQFGVDDKVLANFDSGHTAIDFDSEECVAVHDDIGGQSGWQNVYELEVWLNRLGELLNEYKKDTVCTRRKARRRR